MYIPIIYKYSSVEALHFLANVDSTYDYYFAYYSNREFFDFYRKKINISTNKNIKKFCTLKEAFNYTKKYRNLKGISFYFIKLENFTFDFIKLRNKSLIN